MSLLKKSLDLTAVNLSQQILNLLFIFLISHQYTSAQYADYRQTFLPFEVASPLLTFSLPAAIFYFYPRFSDKSKLLTLSLHVIALTTFVAGIIIFCGGAKWLSSLFDNEISDYLYLIPFFAFFSIGTTVYQSFLVLSNKTSLLYRINLPINFVSICLLLLCTYLKINIEYLIYLRILTYCVNFLLLTFFIFKSFSYNFFNVDTKSYKTIIGFSYSLTLAAIIGTLSYELDKIIISSYDSPENFAIYINGAFEIPMISILTGAVSSAMLSQLSPLLNENKYKEAASLFKNTISLTAQFIIPIFIFSLFNSEEIILLLFGDKYLDSILPFRIYLLLLPIRVIFYGQALIALGKSKIILKRGVIELIINLILSLILFKIIGFNGVAIATVITILIWTVPFNLYEIKRGFGVKILEIIPLKKIGNTMLISGIIYIPTTLLINELVTSLLLGFIIKLIIGCGLYILVLKKFNLINYTALGNKLS
ncbi:lipopolysaccharide biosynthesis protein [Pontibacter pudoricolor]|uniref:lipopolysaccharide biosynthesis protein n=1 Tax=Pontibacter pudoricolor TaxID=2694930 RepID=UPI001390D371|nr:oligosaccharide flippase family protein [Pontibacter pudoricolor]